MPIAFLIAILLFILLAMSAAGIPLLPTIAVMVAIIIVVRRLAGGDDEFASRNGLGSGIPLGFDDGISAGRFKAIGYDARKSCRADSVVADPSGHVTMKWHSNSGQTAYEAVYDFNDGGHLTGRSRPISGCYDTERARRIVSFIATKIRQESQAAAE